MPSWRSGEPGSVAAKAGCFEMRGRVAQQQHEQERADDGEAEHHEALKSTSTFCGGNAGPDDVHLAATIHCMDGEIVAWLEQRERRKRRRKEKQEPLPLALTDGQLSQVTQAASLIAPAARDGFLRSVASVLGGRERPSDGAVTRALGDQSGATRFFLSRCCRFVTAFAWGAGFALVAFGFCPRNIYEPWYFRKVRKEVRDDFREVHDHAASSSRNGAPKQGKCRCRRGTPQIAA
jgi:hypothetical protein